MCVWGAGISSRAAVYRLRKNVGSRVLRCHHHERPDRKVKRDSAGGRKRKSVVLACDCPWQAQLGLEVLLSDVIFHLRFPLKRHTPGSHYNNGAACDAAVEEDIRMATTPLVAGRLARLIQDQVRVFAAGVVGTVAGDPLVCCDCARTQVTSGIKSSEAVLGAGYQQVGADNQKGFPSSKHRCKSLLPLVLCRTHCSVGVSCVSWVMHVPCLPWLCVCSAKRRSQVQAPSTSDAVPQGAGR